MQSSHPDDATASVTAQPDGNDTNTDRYRQQTSIVKVTGVHRATMHRRTRRLTRKAISGWLSLNRTI
jgi:hypothetical protein